MSNNNAARQREFEEQEKKRGKQQWIQFCCLSVAAVGMIFFSRWYDRIPPEPNYSGYYDGPWVNKKGELVAPDGKIIQTNYQQSKNAPSATNYVPYVAKEQ